MDIATVESKLRYLASQSAKDIQNNDHRELEESLGDISEVIEHLLSEIDEYDEVSPEIRSFVNNFLRESQQNYQYLYTISRDSTEDCIRPVITSLYGPIIDSVRYDLSRPLVELLGIQQDGYRRLQKSDCLTESAVMKFVRQFNDANSEFSRRIVEDGYEGEYILGGLIRGYKEIFHTSTLDEEVEFFKLWWRALDTGSKIDVSDPDQQASQDSSIATPEELLHQRTYLVEKTRFAVIAWLLRANSNETIDEKFVEQALQYVIESYQKSRSPLERISRIYASFSFDDPVNWDNWQRRHELETTLPGEAFSFSTAEQTWLLKFYLKIGPALITESVADKILTDEQTPLPTTEGAAMLFNRVEGTEKDLFEIDESSPMLSTGKKSSYKQDVAFLEAHRLAKKQFEEKQVETIKESALADERVESFRQEFKESLESDFRIREILSTISDYQQLDREVSKVSTHEIQTKDRFTDVRNVHYTGPRFHQALSKLTEILINDLVSDTSVIDEWGDLPKELLRIVDATSTSAVDAIVVEPELRLGQYTDADDRYSIPTMMNERPSSELSPSLYLDEVPILTDPIVSVDGCAALVFTNMSEAVLSESQDGFGDVAVNQLSEISESELKERYDTPPEIEEDVLKRYVEIEYEYWGEIEPGEGSIHQITYQG